MGERAEGGWKGQHRYSGHYYTGSHVSRLIEADTKALPCQCCTEEQYVG